MAFCSAAAKLFRHNLMKYNLLKITSVKDQSNIFAKKDFIKERK